MRRLLPKKHVRHALRAVVAALTASVSISLILLLGSASADPSAAPVSVMSGTVPAGGEQTVTAASPVTTHYADTLMRITVTGGSGFLDIQNQDLLLGVDANETVWDDLGALTSGDVPSFVAKSQSQVPLTVQIAVFAVPAAPTSFSGSSFEDPGNPYDDPQNSSDDSATSTLEFSVPNTAPYVANVTVSSGSITLSAGSSLSNTQGPTRTVSSYAAVPLGTLQAGTATLTVSPTSTSSAKWSIAIAPQALEISNLRFSTSAAPPGLPVSLTFSLNGAAVISAYVTNSRGATVRILASHLAVPYQIGGGNPVPDSLSWNGRDSRGHPVPNGTYVAHVLARSTNGTSATAQAALTINAELIAEANRVKSAVDKILATDPRVSQEQYYATRCTYLGSTNFRGHSGLAFRCAIASRLPVEGTTLYAVVVGSTVYLDVSRPCLTAPGAGGCVSTPGGPSNVRRA